MLLLAASVGTITTSTMADTFGTGANSFTMDFVTIGNPGNASDPGGAPGPGGVPIPAGSVSYTYRIGTYEVNADMMSKANTLGGLNIPFHDVGANNPASLITWNMACLLYTSPSPRD